MPIEHWSDGYPAHPDAIHCEPDSPEERARRERYLEQLRRLVKPDADESLSLPRLSTVDECWTDWLDRTGELPPDFDRLPATATLPDPLSRRTDDGLVEITDEPTWERQRTRLKNELQYWLYGELPPAPDDVDATTLATHAGDDATVRDVRLTFGSGNRAELTLQTMIPDGSGPFPVVLTQWSHRKWARLAVRRGYMAVVYAANDGCDDTATYQDHYPEYDFQLLARRAWAAHRVVDYLETLDEADADCIGITGASRNGKQALIAAAFDDRIGAVVPCSAGSGAVVPARFDRDDYYAGDMSLHARIRRSWFHPRWRFFVGRENRLPVDANSLVSLVAPRPCMLHTALNERTTSAWAVDRVYESANSVYELLDAEANLALRCRQGRHARTTRDVQHIIDFFDYAFDRGPFDSPTRRYHAFSFADWAETAAPDVDVGEFPERGIDTLLSDDNGRPIRTTADWERRKSEICDRIRWSFGERPPRPTDSSVTDCDAVRRRPGRSDFTNHVIGRPEASEGVDKLRLSPRKTAGDRFESDLYLPADDRRDGEPVPVVVWLHPFSYNTGYGTADRGQVPITEATDRGLGLLGFDQLGFGTRTIEGARFYDRHPTWSKMGKMVEDALAAVETLSALEYVDSDRVFLLGYSLGATVGLYAAALDERIAGVASVCGFASLRSSDTDAEREHATIGRLSHLHGLQPRLGLFRDDPGRMPFDFHEVLGLVAPRPLLAVAPSLDWTHPQEDALACVREARTVYELYDAAENLEYRAPEDALRFDYHEARLNDETRTEHESLSPDRRSAVFDWLANQRA